MNNTPLPPLPTDLPVADDPFDTFARAIIDARQHVEEEFDDGFDLGPLPDAYAIDPPFPSKASASG